MRSIYTGLLLLLFSQSGYAAVTTFDCKYLKAADKSKFITNDPMVLMFIIDSNTKKAYMRGNIGTEEVKWLPNAEGGVTFIEITTVGNVMTTSVDQNGESVHSRNTIIRGKLLASQYYGQCKISH